MDFEILKPCIRRRMAAIGTSRLTALEEFISKGINNISLCENPLAKTKDCEDEFTCDFNSVFNFLLVINPIFLFLLLDFQHTYFRPMTQKATHGTIFVHCEVSPQECS